MEDGACWSADDSRVWTPRETLTYWAGYDAGRAFEMAAREDTREQEMADALAALLVAYRYTDPRDEWLARRDEAINRARSLLTDAEMERAEKLVIHPGDFDDLRMETT